MSKQLKECQQYVESINISINSDKDWKTSIGSYFLVKKNTKYHLARRCGNHGEFNNVTDAVSLKIMSQFLYILKDSLNKNLAMVHKDLYQSLKHDFKYKNDQLIKEHEKQRLRNINLEVQVDFWKNREKRLHSYFKRFFKGMSFNDEQA